MLPKPLNYQIYPAVVPGDVSVSMTIVPTEKAFLFADGAEYKLTLIQVNGDEADYSAPVCRKSMLLTASGGVLRFDYIFAAEQEHTLILEKDDKKIQEFTVFSLFEDLYRLRPFKGDLHAHSYRSDGKQDPAALAGHFREQGYDFFALTDHNRYFPGGEIDETFAGVRTGFTRMYGEEVHAPGSVVHIVHVGGTSSITDVYVHDNDAYQTGLADCESRMPDGIPEQYKDRYIRAMWATEKIHEAGGLAIFAHPYWRPGSRVYNVCDEFAGILLTSGMFDAYELIGGMKQIGNNRSVALWGELRAKGLHIPCVGSSDVHGIEKSETFPHFFTLCFAEENTNDSLADAVRRGNCVAVEAVGDEYARQYRCYGSLRLVTYAQFLMTHFYPGFQRVSQGEGVSMRAYAMEDAPAALIEMQAEQCDRYRNRFFGDMPPALPTPAMLAFEEKWREVQRNGPQTKGSRIDTAPNFQI